MNHATTRILSLNGQYAQPHTIRAKAFVFHDPISQQLLHLIQRLAPSDAPILIHGETGTGKELVARHIHELSGRDGPFLAVNCSAINDQLAESEFFGHEAGSFTGATTAKKGWFESAEGGTIFLDEIGDLPMHLQVKLLRVLQEKEVVRVGARHPININVRIITATNIDLEDAVRASRFRKDLLFRINIAQLDITPLRERTGDILPLFEHFVEVYRKKAQRASPLHISATAIAQLYRYPWPGNIRELENIAHYAVLVAEGNSIQINHLKLSKSLMPVEPNHGPLSQPHTETPYDVIEQQLERLFSVSSIPENTWDRLEKIIIGKAYEACHQNQVKTAQLLGVTRNVLRTLLKRHQLLHESRQFNIEHAS